MLSIIVILSLGIAIVPLVVFWVCVQLIITRKCGSKICLIGKTAIVTGGNKGIGFEVSLGLASRGCKVIIACRSKAEAIRHVIISRTHNPNVFVKQIDLSSIDSVRKFASEIRETEKSLDILINNAGICRSSLKQTPDGLNPVMQVNYFGHFLLTHLLIDLLKKSPASRILFVSSKLAFLHNLSLDTLNPLESSTSYMQDIQTYFNSNVCSIIATHVMAEKLRNHGVIVNIVSPGAVQTSFYKEILKVRVNRMYLFLIYAFSYFFLKTPEQGAQPLLKAAVSDRYRHVTGRFIWDFSWFPTPRCSRNKNFCRQIWEASEKYVLLTMQERM